jgi:hypothetical protein
MNKFPNIKVEVACLPNCEGTIRKIFLQILEDYCLRFNVLPQTRKIKVQICLVEYDEETLSSGLTSYNEDEGRILIQTRDPFMSDWEPNFYTMHKFVCIMCHEFVHGCQYITEREGFDIHHNWLSEESGEEEYFFDPAEMEARTLEAFYTSKFGYVLL